MKRKKYMCEECGKYFSTYKGLLYHILGSHDHDSRGWAYETLKERGWLKKRR